MLQEKDIQLFLAAIKKFFPTEREDYSHSITHTYRVISMAQKIAQKESADTAVVTIAGLFHDVARAMEDRGECDDHAKKSAEICRKELSDLKYEESFVDQVVDCIVNHRSKSTPSSLEARVLRDADKLDSLGTIGIVRTIGSSLQSKMYNRPIHDHNGELIGDGKKSAVHYIQLKVEEQESKNLFYTKTAYEMSRKKLNSMKQFLSNFLDEYASGVNQPYEK